MRSWVHTRRRRRGNRVANRKIDSARHPCNELWNGLEEIEQSTLVDLNRTFSDLTQEEREKWFHEHDLASHSVVRTIGSITLQNYYCDPRVLESLGAEPRAPFPQGFEVKQGDLVAFGSSTRTRSDLSRNELTSFSFSSKPFFVSELSNHHPQELPHR